LCPIFVNRAESKNKKPLKFSVFRGFLPLDVGGERKSRRLWSEGGAKVNAAAVKKGPESGPPSCFRTSTGAQPLHPMK
jgi:hypothetical protein